MKRKRSALAVVANKLWQALALVGCGALMSFLACAKCPIATLVIEGNVAGPLDSHDSLVVSTIPYSQARQPSVQVIGNHFVAEVRFNTLRAAGRWYHDCSWKPETIVIALLRDGVTLDEVKLHFATDFLKDRDVTYHAVRPVSLVKKH